MSFWILKCLIYILCKARHGFFVKGGQYQMILRFSSLKQNYIAGASCPYVILDFFHKISVEWILHSLNPIYYQTGALSFILLFKVFMFGLFQNNRFSGISRRYYFLVIKILPYKFIGPWPPFFNMSSDEVPERASFEEEDDSFNQLETVEHLTSTWGFI